MHARSFFEIEKYRNRYRYFYKHYGAQGARRCRIVTLVWLGMRRLGYGLLGLTSDASGRAERLALYRLAMAWNQRVDPVRLVECREEPAVSETFSPVVGPCPPARDK